jgi:membrane protein
VRLSSALVGGILAGVLWHLAGSAFTRFIVSSTQYTAIYSSFAILIFFLLWLYIGWLITLLGAEVAYLHQYRAYQSRMLTNQTDSTLARERLALSVLLEATRRHLNGRPPASSSELATLLGVSFTHMEEMIETLTQAGLLLRTITPDGVTLARAPELITVHDTLTMLHGNAAPEPVDTEQDPVSWVLAQRTHAIATSLHDVTLRTLAEKAGEASDTASSHNSHVDKEQYEFSS